MRTLAQRAFEKYQRDELWCELSIFTQDEIVGFTEAVAAELEDDVDEQQSCTDCRKRDAEGRCISCLRQALADAMSDHKINAEVIKSVLIEAGL
jgi:hypothetical protein